MPEHGPDERADRDRDPGTVARTARERLDDVTVEDGSFAVVCTETGTSPEPVSSATFVTYADAERGRELARTYREAMREVDPGLPTLSLVVTELDREGVEVVSVRESTGDRRENGLPRTSRTVTVAGDRRDEWIRVDNAPVVDLTGRGTPLDDEVVSRQLRSELNL
jgi:hypothetical protein